MSLFLLIIVIEELTWLIKKVVELSLFKGFRVNEETSYIMVQFTDDTLFVREGNWDNIWCMKDIHRGFEMVSGLKVNFFKSSISIVNLKAGFLEATFVFLNCAVSSLPLKFLGIMVGDSPRKVMSWKSVFEVLRKKISCLEREKFVYWW